MDIKWSREARSNFMKIKSKHFSESETKEYKKKLAIRNKVATMMEIMPANQIEWKGNYMVLVDNYKVFYSFLEDKNTCYIKAFKHQSQN